MSLKFYSYLWVLFFAAAGLMWLAGLLSMEAIIVFGFVSFGLVFMGMMNVLPLMVSHPHQPSKKSTPAMIVDRHLGVERKPAATAFSAYRSV